MTTDELPRALSPAYLTDVLRRCGALGDGQVSEVTLESSSAKLVSRIIRVRLTYDGHPNGAPDGLLLKTALIGGAIDAPDAGRKEVAFYNEVATATLPGLLPRCFEASWDPEAKTWHLLLEDLTDSHFVVTVWPVPPTVEQCGRIVDTYARFHASWWNDPRLGASIGTVLDAATLNAFLGALSGWFESFVDRLGDRLSPERLRLYERFIAAAPRLLAHDHSRLNLTVVNGDAHVWNLLYPREPSSGDVRLIDWSAWRIDTATDDLAYMMAVHWYPERRRRLEEPLLDRYHATLVAHGVTGYDRKALAEDYRLSVLWQLTTPVWQAEHKLPPLIWWSHLERILLAVDDLGCRNFLD
jgi:hypothetical protein